MENSGMVGGCIYDEPELLAHLQQVFTQIRSGIQPRNIPFFIPEKPIPTFNYPSLLQRNFSVEDCPADSVFLGRPQSFWQQNKYLLLFSGITIVILLIIFFIRNYIRSLKALNKAQQKQVETSHKLELVLSVSNTIPWHMNLPEEIIYWDTAPPLNQSSTMVISEPNTATISLKECFERVHKEDLKRVQRIFHDVLKNNVQKIHEEFRISGSAAYNSQGEWVEIQAAVKTVPKMVLH